MTVATGTQKTPTDAHVVHRVLGGDRGAFRILIDRHQNRVFSLLKRLVRSAETAEDLGQEAFLRAYTKLDKFDQTMSFQNWILKIAQNLAYTWLKRSGVDRERLILDGPEDRGTGAVPDESPLSDPENVAQQRAVADVAREAMERLPEKYRVVLTLRYTEERSYQEISRILEIPLGTVKFRLFQAHKYLNDSLTRFGVIER